MKKKINTKHQMLYGQHVPETYPPFEKQTNKTAELVLRDFRRRRRRYRLHELDRKQVYKRYEAALLLKKK